MTNKDLIEQFYLSFSNGDAKGMTACYHQDIIFQDPVFGKLKGERAGKMWEMLLSQKTNTIKITFGDIESNNETGHTNWKAEYIYSKTNRKVINHVQANFKFRDGKIIEHIDTFNLWKWTQQAIGIIGYLIGWTPFMKSKIRKTVTKALDKFISKGK